MSRMHSIFMLVFLWTAWCFVHSLLISTWFTVKMQKVLGDRFRYYRLAYNIFSLISLLPVMYLHFSLNKKVMFVWPWPWSLLKLGMYAAAFLFFYGGYKVYNMQYMLGLKQIGTMRHKTEPDKVEFTTKGILGYVRHPWYSGSILLVWAYGDISDVSLAAKIVLTAYIIIGTVLEEKKLVHELGQQYIAYQSRVPMLVPWKIFILSS